MKGSTASALIILLLILSGGPYGVYTQPAAQSTAGINGSQDQGYLGGESTGTPQQPGADGAEGTVVGNNLVLGTDGNATLGTYLIAYNGMTLYTYSKDTGKDS